jgi:hypothetical protein
VSSNLANGEVYLIHYVIKFVSDFTGWWFPPPIELTAGI